MSKKPIHSATGPVAGAPYTPAMRVGDTVYVSGQIPLDPATGKIVEGDFEAQVAMCLSNLEALLVSDGLSLDNVVKTTCFLVDLGNFASLNKVYGPKFTGIPPARSTVQVSRLPLDSQVEIEAIAVAF